MESKSLTAEKNKLCGLVNAETQRKTQESVGSVCMESRYGEADMKKIREMLASGDDGRKNEAFRMLCTDKFERYEQQYGDEIDARIERHRKGNFTVKVTDANGKPLAGKRVRIRQTEHDFKYGANIFLLDEFAEKERNDAYRDNFHRYFNLATVPFYWAELEPEQGKLRFDADSPKIYRRPAPDLCVDYCREKGILPKLHCLLYDKFLPKWVPRDDPKAMMALYETRFAQIAERYAGKMYEFEVTNEFLDEYRWGNSCSALCGERDVLRWAYEQARKYFPNETLVLNEGPRIPEIALHDYRSYYFMMVDALLSKGASIDKLGVQNHIFCGARGPQEEVIFQFLQHYDPQMLMRGWGYLGEFGKPMEVTEVTVPTFGDSAEAEQLQADVLSELYRLWFSIPGMETIVYWNTVEGTAYAKPDGSANENNVRGGLFHSDCSPKRSALAMRDLFEKVWHTEAEGVTDENGCITLRGFYGEYDADVEGKPFVMGIHQKTANSKTVAMTE